MRKLIILMAFLQALYPMNRDELDKKFDELVQVRETIESSKISKLNNPFYIERVKGETKVITFTLYAIVDKRVKINSKWYELNDDITAGYRVVSVNKESVGISNQNNYLELNLKDNKNVKINLK